MPYESAKSEVADLYLRLRQANSPQDLVHTQLRHYLSLFETLGVGVHDDVFDLEVIRALDGERIIAIWTAYSTFVQQQRDETGSQRAYWGLEYLSQRLRVPEQPVATVSLFGRRPDTAEDR